MSLVSSFRGRYTLLFSKTTINTRERLKEDQCGAIPRGFS